MRIESRLRVLAQEEPYANRLLAQWVFDKELVGQALLGTVQSFPHYSLHDRSHSETILDRIAKLLGPKRVAKIEATDAWLLLESAYWHDIGMVTTEEEARRWLQGDPGFSEFLRSIKINPRHELYQHVCRLESRDRVGAQDWLLDQKRSLVLVLAEFVRRQHSGRSGEFARSPKLLQLESPRNTLIPRRLWDLLGRICTAHGQGHDDVMRLPRTELGLGTDEAHPRFIACMLRLGDLLDLDDGRFCPVLGATFHLPLSSALHEEKHAAIRHLHVCPERVEVEAYCASDFDVYKVVDDWLTLLRGELRDQAAHWLDIAPSSDFGAAPSDGGIRVTMEDEIHLGPPRFSIDSDSALELFRGTGIYKDPSGAFIREILQNSVDATILRAFRERQSDISAEPSYCHIEHEILKHFPISVTFEEISRSEDGAQSHWQVRVRDHGSGISRDDLQFLRKVGSSRQNLRRAELIADMPEWFRPSGFFGLGMQSIFYVADEFTIQTRHHESMEILKLRGVRERGTHDSGRLVVWEVPTTPERRHPQWFPAGTEVTIRLTLDRVPDRVRLGIGSVGSEIMRRFDGLVDQDFPINIAWMCDYAISLSENFSCACNVSWRPVGRNPIVKNVRRAMLNHTTIDFLTNFGLRVDKFSNTGSVLKVLYRGMPLDDSRLRVTGLSGFIGGVCDIRAGVASDYLGASRDNLLESSQDDFDGRFWVSYCHALPKVLHGLRREVSDSSSEETRSREAEAEAETEAETEAELEGKLSIASLEALLVLDRQIDIVEHAKKIRRLNESQAKEVEIRLQRDLARIREEQGDEWRNVEIAKGLSLGTVCEWPETYVWVEKAGDFVFNLSRTNPLGQEGEEWEGVQKVRIRHQGVLHSIFPCVSFVGMLPPRTTETYLQGPSRRLQEGVVSVLRQRDTDCALGDAGLRFSVETCLEVRSRNPRGDTRIPRPGVGKRWVTWCPKDFQALSTDVRPLWSGLLWAGLPPKSNQKPLPIMIFPFSPSDDDSMDVFGLEQQVEWALKHPASPRTRAEVCRALEALVRKVDGWWRESPSFRRAYDVEEIGQKLRSIANEK